MSHLEPLGWQVTSRIDTQEARMYKVDTIQPGGIPVELIDIVD